MQTVAGDHLNETIFYHSCKRCRTQFRGQELQSKCPHCLKTSEKHTRKIYTTRRIEKDAD